MQKTKLLHEVRAVKTKKELASIVKAQRISEKVLSLVLKELCAGVTEIEIADFIKKSFVKLGAPILSFSPIVAFGHGSADVHHEPSKTKLKKGDIIMFDFGCTVNHYCSDMTRTYFWGEPTKKQQRLYCTVLAAQMKALRLIEKGERSCKKIDTLARKYLEHEYPGNFQHGLGHGVGTVIHEWPNFKPKSEDTLPVGCVMTVEPGIYIKGLGGVRIEDMIVITKNGCHNLTKVPKSIESAVLK